MQEKVGCDYNRTPASLGRLTTTVSLGVLPG